MISDKLEIIFLKQSLRMVARSDLVNENQGGLLELPANWPEVESGETREIAAKKAETSIKIIEVSSAYLTQARFVLRHCRDKAEEVLRNCSPARTG